MNRTSELNVYFDSPRLRLSVPGRMTVRVLAWSGNLLLIAGTAMALLSDLKFLFWIGACGALFILDRLIHWGEGDLPLSELPQHGDFNLERAILPTAFSVLEKAFDKSTINKEDFHLRLLMELGDQKEIREIIQRLGIDAQEWLGNIKKLIEESKASLQASLSSPELLREADKLLISAFRKTAISGNSFIGSGEIFSAVLETDKEVILRLKDILGLEDNDLSISLAFAEVRRKNPFFRKIPLMVSSFVRGADQGIRRRVVNRAWTSRPTPVLDSCSLDLTAQARKGQVGFLIGHDEEYERMIRILSKADRGNALLVGDPGIGKEAIVNRLAFNIIKDKVPQPLFDKRLLALNVSALVSGASAEEAQEKVNRMVTEIIVAGNVILYVPDIHNLLKTSEANRLSAADAFLPAFLKGGFPVIGATYPRAYKSALEPRSDISSLFEVITMEELSEEEAARLLTYDSLILERKYRITATIKAIRMAARLAKKYFHARPLPGSAEELLKESFLAAQAATEKVLTPERVVAVAEERVNIPMHEATADETEKLLHLEERIHERLIDQEEAVRAVADALRAYRSGLARQKGPIASFLFVGPTGVGKTELAKIIATIEFGSEDSMVRFDMTEYQDKASITRFIGSPDGAVRGALTDRVLAKPYSLVLLDEFEKAHPDIVNLFLQVLDDGRLTDGLDRTVDFKNTIVIATSNAHADLINTALRQGQGIAEIAEYLKKKLVDVFKPELLNRFSKIIVFKDLSPADMRKIARLQLVELARLMSAQHIGMDFDDSAVELAAKLGFDPSFGARPLRRVIEERLKAVLARKMLGKEISRGARLTVGAEGSDFVVR